MNSIIPSVIFLSIFLVHSLEFAKLSKQHSFLEDGPLILTDLSPDEAKTKSKVTLPGMEGLENYAGFFRVNKTSNGCLFMWFFPALNKNTSAPVLLWLQGGPGAPSVYAIFDENGPIVIDSEGQPSSRNVNWVQKFNVLYIDNPVGTGYSFVRDKTGLSTNENQIADNLYAAMLQFFHLFGYKDNEFYITGESYAGKYIPALAYKIHTSNPGATSKINFKGVAIGNGLVDPENQVIYYGDLLYAFGLVDMNQKEFIDKESMIAAQFIKNKQFTEAFLIFDALLNGDKFPYPTYFKNVTGCDFYYNIEFCHAQPGMDYYFKYIANASVRQAIHVGDEPFKQGPDIETALINDMMQSLAYNLSVIMDNYKVLLYNGNLDIIVGTILTEGFLSVLNWTGAEQYKRADRVPWRVDKSDTEVAGYVKRVGQFYHIAVRKAGHMVPHDQPRVVLDMLNRFIYDLF